MKKKISHSRVSEAFNEELQVDVQSALIWDDKLENRNTAEMGTSISESSIALSRFAASIMSLIVTSRLDRYGFPKTLGACPKILQTRSSKTFNMWSHLSLSSAFPLPQ